MDSHTSKISLKTVISALVFTGIFFLPFNSFEGIPILGEFSKDSCTLFFLAAAFLLGIKTLATGKIKIPYKNLIFQGVCLFILWMLLATLLNIHNISSYYFKHTTGFARFFTQFLSLLFSAGIFFLVYYNVFQNYTNEELFSKIRKIFMYSFIIVSIYAILEILILKFNIWSLEPVIHLFDYFPFTEVNLDTRNTRISSVTFETPALGTYLLTIAGWMFSYILTGNGVKKYIPAVLVIVFALFSGSRSALFIIFCQALCFGFFLLRKKSHQVLLTKIIIFGFLACSVIFLFRGKQITEYIAEKVTSFGIHNETHAVSNKTRFGIQYTLGLVFLENPISGVGLGQQAFPSHHLYPDWATENNYEFRVRYLNPDDPSFPPGFNFYMRLLAESGAVGLLIFLVLLGTVFYVCLRLIGKERLLSVLGIVIFISMVGAVFNWLKMDSFRTFTFWIHLALLITIMRNQSNNFFDKSISKK